jgi:hypothetical protein
MIASLYVYIQQAYMIHKNVIECIDVGTTFTTGGFGRVPTLSGTGMSEDKQAVLLNLPRQLDKERSNANTTTGSSQNSKQTVDDDKEMDTNQSPSSESLADSNMPDPQNCLQVQEMGTDDMCLQDLVHSRTQRIKTSLKLL